MWPHGLQRFRHSSSGSLPNAASSPTAPRTLPPTGCAMSDTVVDSSVAAKWILPEADSAQALRLVTEVALAGERLIVLDLAFVEISNAILKRVHRGLSPF